MSKIAQKIKNAINKQNWEDVCDAYYTLTGEKISPPKTEKIIDVNCMSKKQLHAYLKNELKLDFISSITNYDIADLILIHKEYTSGEIKESSTQVEHVSNNPDSDINASPQPQYTFISKSKARNVLNGDKSPIPITLKDFPSYGDEVKSNVTRGRRSQLVSATCRKCNKTSRVNPLVLIKGTDNERTYICEGCS